MNAGLVFTTEPQQQTQCLEFSNLGLRFTQLLMLRFQSDSPIFTSAFLCSSVFSASGWGRLLLLIPALVSISPCDVFWPVTHYHLGNLKVPPTEHSSPAGSERGHEAFVLLSLGYLIQDYYFQLHPFPESFIILHIFASE